MKKKSDSHCDSSHEDNSGEDDNNTLDLRGLEVSFLKQFLTDSVQLE